MQKHKILFIVSTLKHSGTIIQIFNIAKYLNSAKFQLIAITLSPEEPGSMLERFEKIGTEVHSLNLSRIEGMISGRVKLRKLVDKINPDIIHTQGIRSDGYSIGLAKKYIVVSSMQNYPFFDYPMYYGRIRGRFMAHKHLATIKKRQNFIACSKSVANEFKINNGVTLPYIQNGVDTDIFYPVSDTEKRKLKSKLDLPGDKKIILSVGALIPRKDMETVIKAFNNLIDKEICLVITGEGQELAALQSITGQKGNVKFSGNVSNVNEYLQASDFFISASWAEGLPNTVLEAMACGLPVILSDIEPHKEVFEAGDYYPYFFKIKDYVLLTEHIQKMVADNYKNLSKKMIKIIHDNFTARVMSSRYQQLYQKLLMN